MKKLLTSVMICLSVTVFGQKADSTQFHFANADISTGVTPLTAGVTANISYLKSTKRGNDIVTLTANNDFGMVVYSQALSKRVSLWYSGGYYKNHPWIGPGLVWSLGGKPNNPLMTFTHWFGPSFGNPDSENYTLTPQFFFSYQEISVNYGRGIRINGLIQNYRDSKQSRVLVLKKTFSINQNVKIWTSGGYNFPYQKPLWGIGISISKI